jgi:hypothetical protein
MHFDFIPWCNAWVMIDLIPLMLFSPHKLIRRSRPLKATSQDGCKLPLDCHPLVGTIFLIFRLDSQNVRSSPVSGQCSDCYIKLFLKHQEAHSSREALSRSDKSQYLFSEEPAVMQWASFQIFLIFFSQHNYLSIFCAGQFVLCPGSRGTCHRCIQTSAVSRNVFTRV